MARISVIGTGYVGLVSGIGFAYLGHDVLGLDKDPFKVARLKAGELPIYEPELDEMFSFVRSEGRINFTEDYAEAVGFADFIFTSVGTPPRPDGSADLSFVESALQGIAEHLQEGDYKIIVNKSTVPVGTGRWARAFLLGELTRRGIRHPEACFDVVSNPEFLREGKAVYDFMNPDRVVIGSDNREAAWKVASLYEKVNPTLLVCDIATAEMIKYASNAFLATKISFINEIANMCERLGADVDTVSRGLGLDHRISPYFLKAGLGFGGSCFPKDVSALISTARSVGVEVELLSAVMKVNARQRMKPVEALRGEFASLKGRSVGLLGLAFKPGTDDVRQSPAIDIARALLEEGARLTVHDPVAVDNFLSALGDLADSVRVADDPQHLIKDCEAVVVVTDWPEYKDINPTLFKGKVVYDGRNIYNPELIRRYARKYIRVG